MSEFTNGPWEVGILKENQQVFKDRKCVTNCCVPMFTVQECEANAHLIAAAPEMYEALQHVTKNPFTDEWYEKINLILEKARGES